MSASMFNRRHLLAASVAVLGLQRQCIGADLRVRRDAARHHQPHHQLRHLQGAEGEGQPQHAGAATAGESVMIAIVGRGEADFAMANAPEIGAADRQSQGNLRMIGPVYTLKTGFWVRKDSSMQIVVRSQGQARDHGLFRDARARSDVARDPGDRRPHRERYQAGAGAERGALGGRFRRPARPTCSCSRSARRKCARST